MSTNNQLLNSIFEVINKNIDKTKFVFEEIDLSVDDNYAIRYAATNEHLEVLRLLVNYKRDTV